MKGRVRSLLRKRPLLRNLRLRPKTAFSRFPPVNGADLERQQRVDLTRSPSSLGTPASCAFRPMPARCGFAASDLEDCHLRTAARSVGLVLAKWLLTNSEIFIFDEPTRGIDVGAKAEIYALIRELGDKGAAILMISSEMPELLRMSGRILVMHEGDMVGEMSRAEASEERVVAYAPVHRAWSRCALTARVCTCQILSSDGNRSSAIRSWGGCRLRSCREVGQGRFL